MASLYDQLFIPEERRKPSLQREQAEFIFDFLASRLVQQTLETGFAFGCSTAHIMKATNARHIAIDPRQEGYDNIGLSNIAKLGLQPRLRHIRLRSHVALPQLLSEDVCIDFALIDGCHKFDEIFIDWWYISLLLNKGGHVIFDDSWLGATQTVAAFVRSNRKNFREVTATAPSMFMFEKVDRDRSEWTDFQPFSIHQG